MFKISIFITWVLLLYPKVIFAQENKPNNKFTFDISVTPELNVLLVDERLQQRSKTRFGLSSSFNLKYRLSKNWIFRTGVGYGIKRYDYIKDDFKFAILDPVKGFISTSEIVTKFSFAEFQLPIMFQMDIADHKYFISSGIELIRFLKNTSKSTLYHDNGDREELSDISNKAMSNFAVVLGLGYNLKIPNTFKASIEPILKLYYKEYIIEHSQLCNLGLRIRCYW